MSVTETRVASQGIHVLVERLEEVPHHEPGNLPANPRTILLRITEVEPCPHASIVDFRDYLPEPLVVARFTSHEAVDREVDATWAKEALECLGDGRRVTGVS